MRGDVPSYDMRTPVSLGEALAVLAQEPGRWKPFAGGTDLMVLFESGRLRERELLNIAGLKELQGLSYEGENPVRLGALCSFSQIRRHAAFAKEYPLLAQAAQSIGAIAIQNRATVGGNIVNASPAADSPPALLVYDAAVKLLSAKGERELPLADFYRDYKKTALEPHELLHSVTLPRLEGRYVQYFRKVGTRQAQAISKVCMAALLKRQGDKIADVRVAMGSVAAFPLRCRKLEKFLQGKVLDAALIKAAKKELLKDIKPIGDIRSTAAYRLLIAQNLLEEFLHVGLDQRA